MPRAAKVKTAIKPYSKKRKYPAMTGAARSHLPELKFNDIATFQSAADTTGGFTVLNAMIRGLDAANNRIGRKIYVKEIQVKGSVANNAAVSLAQVQQPMQVARIIIFEDTDGTAVPVIADVLNAATARGMLNLDNRDRFKILYDKSYVLAQNMGVITTQPNYAPSPQVNLVDIDLKCNIPTIYNGGTAGTVADINSGAIYMFTCGTTAASGTLAARFDVATRVRFADA